MPSARATLIAGLGSVLVGASIALVLLTPGNRDFAVGETEIDPAPGDPHDPPPAPLAAVGAEVAGEVTWAIEDLGALVAPEWSSPSDRRVVAVNAVGDVLPRVDGRLVAGPGCVDRAVVSGRHVAALKLPDGERVFRLVWLNPRPGEVSPALAIEADGVRPEGVGVVEAAGAVESAHIVERPRAEVVLGPLSLVRGRVVDERGQAIEGARVWAGVCDPTGSPRVVTTEDDGGFELDRIPAGGGVPVVVAAPGFATTQRIVTVPSPRDVTVRLVEAAPPVAVRLVGVSPGVASEARVLVAPASTSTVSVPTMAREYPFFLADLPAVREGLDSSGCGSFALDEQGVARLGDLPAEASIQVWAVDDSFGATAARSVVTRRDRPGQAILRSPVVFGDADVVHGRVVNGAGREVSGAVVHGIAGSADSKPRAFGAAYALSASAHRGPHRVRTRTTSAADGSFTLPAGCREVLVRPAEGGFGVRVGVVTKAPVQCVLPGAVDVDPSTLESGETRVSLRASVTGLLRVREGDSGSWRLWSTDRPFEIGRFPSPRVLRVAQRAVVDGAVYETAEVVAAFGATYVQSHPSGR